MKALIRVCIVIVFSSLLLAQDGQSTFGESKHWRLPTKYGQVDIKLSTIDGNTVLTFAPYGDVILKGEEEAGLLQQVFLEMASLQYSPSTLIMINTWLQNSAYQDDIERVVFQSGAWKHCNRRKYCYQAEQVANEFLSTVDAFKELDAALQQYGLERKSVRVDDMAVAAKRGSVICQGLVVISLRKVN